MSYPLHNVLVTGGAGFIGANFIRHLLAQETNVRVINLDLLTYAGSLDNLVNLPHPDRYHFIHGNICDAVLVKNLLRDHNVDTIVHFAAESHVDRSIQDPGAFIQTNLVGTFTLLEAARQYWKNNTGRFHHVSTDEVFGTLQKNDPAFTEQTKYAPNSPYSASKAGSDHLVRAYFHTYKLPVTTSHCSNNYGPYQHAEKLIPTIIHACLAQKPIPIYGNGSNIRDWLYVEDHCRGIMTILKNGQLGETYNIGGCNEWNNLKLAQYICQVMDELRPQKKSYKELITFVTDRPGHDWRYAIDCTRMRNELNWQPLETFETGIRKTIEFYL
ncbi:MAG TPA: dTDP-glucose 4,6-dehydratase [Hanamia sp.]|nr:dTDP-glucose 4,6-dehydratase [Hanamia sp.]